MSDSWDAVVVGSGPNGLAAGITLAQAGRKVIIFEGQSTIGGGTRTREVTLPGFYHDICSAIHPLGISSPFLNSLPLEQHGLNWLQSPLAMAHPYDDMPPAVLSRSLEETCASLGRDEDAYRRWMSPFVRHTSQIIRDVLRPFPAPFHIPFLLALFGVYSLIPAVSLSRMLFRGPAARGLFAGLAAHAIQPLESPVTSGFGMLMGMMGHAFGWPFPEGGSQRISAALLSILQSLGGQVETGRWVRSIGDLPPSEDTVWDVSPRQLLRLAGDCLPSGYRRRIERYRYGPGVFKLDFALDGPIPWKDEDCTRAATIHIGGTLEEIDASEKAVGQGQVSSRPFVLLAQPSLFDPSRAPAGMHTAWAYCHVPNGSTVNMTEVIEAQIERFAPGFRKRILARHEMSPTAMEAYDPNYVGGDINAGQQDLTQFYTRPVASLDPYHVPGTRIFLCSSSTPPGGGVHGMCGYWAARSVLRALKSR